MSHLRPAPQSSSAKQPTQVPSSALQVGFAGSLQSASREHSMQRLSKAQTRPCGQSWLAKQALQVRSRSTSQRGVAPEQLPSLRHS